MGGEHFQYISAFLDLDASTTLTRPTTLRNSSTGVTCVIVGSALVLPSWSSPSGSEAGREDTMAGSKLAPSSIRERERGVRAGSQGGIRDGGGLGEREGVEGRGGEGRGGEGWGGD